jgi:hypothetical protein
MKGPLAYFIFSFVIFWVHPIHTYNNSQKSGGGIRDPRPGGGWGARRYGNSWRDFGGKYDVLFYLQAHCTHELER